MKTKTNILKYGLIAFALTVISCDKQETETNFPKETVLEEGFKSTTEHFDSEIKESEEALSPLLHMSYDAALSEEEATTKYQKEISKLQKEVGQTNKGIKTIYYTIRTKTGTSAHAATDGFVSGYVFLKTNIRSFYINHTLDNRGDDREKGQWDFYTFYVRVDSGATKWVELTAAVIYLKGTDGWYIEKFDVIINRAHQLFPYNRLIGGSTIKTAPRTWLDSNTNNLWDVYRTGYIGEGRLEYKWPYFY